jgi:hypothetical protein
VEKYGRARQATDHNIIRRMRFACWITKATDTNSEYVILTFPHGNNGYANAPQRYVVRTLPVLLNTMENKLMTWCFYIYDMVLLHTHIGPVSPLIFKQLMHFRGTSHYHATNAT